MPVCPDCNLGIPDTFAKCPDCGGSLMVLDPPGIELDLELVAQLSIETEIALDDEDDLGIEVLPVEAPRAEEPDEAEREPEPEPEIVVEVEPEPEPEPEPEIATEIEPEPAPVPEPDAEVRVLPQPEERKPRLTLAPPPPPKPKTKSAHKPKQKKPQKPKTVVVQGEPERAPEPILQAVPEPEPLENLLGPFLGTLKEVAGLGGHAEDIMVFETAFMLPTDETIDVDEIESAELKKTNLDLYRELCLHVKGGATRTMRWLPEYNEDLAAVPLLRSALGDRLQSFEPNKR